ncbi:hypothetical protein BD769DRAFT_1496426, partial [Suillus cothurnatus]
METDFGGTSFKGEKGGECIMHPTQTPNSSLPPTHHPKAQAPRIFLLYPHIILVIVSLNTALIASHLNGFLCLQWYINTEVLTLSEVIFQFSGPFCLASIARLHRGYISDTSSL